MIDGTSTLDLLTLPPDRFVNHVLAWFRERVKDWDKFERDLYMGTGEGPWSRERMAANWHAFATEFTGSPTGSSR